MTHEQFYFWLEGYLEDKVSLDEGQFQPVRAMLKVLQDKRFDLIYLRNEAQQLKAKLVAEQYAECKKAGG